MRSPAFCSTKTSTQSCNTIASRTKTWRICWLIDRASCSARKFLVHAPRLPSFACSAVALGVLCDRFRLQAITTASSMPSRTCARIAAWSSICDAPKQIVCAHTQYGDALLLFAPGLSRMNFVRADDFRKSAEVYCIHGRLTR